MKKTLLGLILACSMFGQSFGKVEVETNSHKWTRRVLSTTACAVSAADGWQTVNALNPGIKEANPLGVNGALAFKGVSCASIWYIGEKTSHKKMALWQSIAMTALYTGVIFHNQSVINNVSK